MNYFRKQNINQNLNDYMRLNPLLTSHLGKTLIDIEEKKNRPDFRKYKDETTTQFNKSFFINQNNDIRDLKNFTFYTFQKINFDIISKINNFLIILDENINYNEDIILIFKGGNVMNFYINNMIETMLVNNQNNNPDDPNYFRNLITELNASSISDTDYTIYILTEDERKFNLIYKFVSDILYQSLIEIRNNFEGLLNHKIINGNDDNNNYFNYQNLDDNNPINDNDNYFYNETVNPNPNINILDIEKDVLQKLNSILNMDNIDQISNIFLEIINILINNGIIQQRQDNNNIYNYSIFKDIYNGSRYIKMLRSISFFNIKYNNMPIIIQNNNPPEFNLNFIYDDINNIIENQENVSNIRLNNVLFDLNDFYSTDKINNFLNSICEEFNINYVNKSYYEYVPGQNKSISEYKMNDAIEDIIYIRNPDIRIDINNDIDNSPPTTYLSKKKDFILRNIPKVNFTEYIENNNNDNKHYHYITVNSSVNNIFDPSRIIQFDLYRIKINVVLSHIININNNTRRIKKLNIPSEFIDVSIPKFNDSGLSNFRKKIYSDNYTYDKFFSKLSFQNNKNILMYNLSYLIDDLSFVLLSQNNFCPWADSKYNKRLKRIALLSFIIFIKKSSVDDGIYNATQQYLTQLRSSLKMICNYLYSYYNNLGYFNNLQYFNNSGYLNDDGQGIKNEYRPLNPIIQYENNRSITEIKNLIRPFIENNINDCLFNINIIKNFEKNSEYFIINYNNFMGDNFDYNLIFKNSFDKLFSFLFRNIIYDMVNDVDSESFYKHIKSQIDKFNVIFDSEDNKNDFVVNFRIENYICLKTFYNIFDALFRYFYLTPDIDIFNNSRNLSIENLDFNGGLLNKIKNNKQSDELNKIKNNNLKKIKEKSIKENQKNKKLNNIQNNNFIEIKEKSIRFNDILIEDLDCDLKINSNVNNNTKNLYCGVLDADYEPSDDYY
jgi:hypothetical protein